MIIDEIFAKTKANLERKKQILGINELEKMALKKLPLKCANSVLAALKRNEKKFNIIAEVKKASPSKGIIRADFAPLLIAKNYAKNGAAAISVLTEPLYFGGSLEILEQISREFCREFGAFESENSRNLEKNSLNLGENSHQNSQNLAENSRNLSENSRQKSSENLSKNLNKNSQNSAQSVNLWENSHQNLQNSNTNSQISNPNSQNSNENSRQISSKNSQKNSPQNVSQNSPQPPYPPLLRKDFIFDEYQLFEALNAGADFVLLIARAFERRELKRLREFAANLGLETLCEVHSEQDAECAHFAGANIVGVNHRNLGDFSVDTSLCERLLPHIKGKIIVAESGLNDKKTLRRLDALGVDAFLIGEHFMRQNDESTALAEFVRR